MLYFAHRNFEEKPVAQDDIVAFYYEVEPGADVVSRLVTVYADGIQSRDSLQLANQDPRTIERRGGAPVINLIECNFMATIDQWPPHSLETISSSEFEEQWSRSMDAESPRPVVAP